ncbi:MAG: sigma 54-interacting transcriptional regulator [Bacillota bacterium]
MRSPKILVILPDDDLKEVVEKTVNELKLEAKLVTGVLEKGVEAAWEGKRAGYDVIVSRGGTAILIQELGPGLPVVEIPVTLDDIIRALYEARTISTNVAVLGFENIIARAQSVSPLLENLMGIQLHCVQMVRGEDFEPKIRSLKALGVGVVVGGILAVDAANRQGISGVLLRSGETAVLSALEEAKRVARAARAAEQRANELKAILDFTYDGIIAIDREGNITVFNPVAERITGLKAEQVLGRNIKSAIPNTRMLEVLKSGEAELNQIQQLGKTQILTNRVPIIVGSEVVGVVATFQDVGKIQYAERKIRRELVNKGHVAKYSFDDIVAVSPAMKQTVEQAKRFASTDSTVLITGETGTGKELFAHAIHSASRRRDQAFVAINCAALPETLLESELFGYAEGAFTDARRGGKEGLFEIAHGGTLFLDEVGEMSERLQARLLRVLQEKEVMRIGDDKIIPVDVRIIAATNKDLMELVRARRFRDDLYYRLSVLNLRIPPLRQRLEDIPELARRLLGEVSQSAGTPVPELSPGALDVLMGHSWPGNVRELKNVLENLCVLAQGGQICREDVQRVLGIQSPVSYIPCNSDSVLEKVEADTILRVLREAGNKKEAAKRLGISTTTLWRKLKAIRAANDPHN